MFIAEDHTLQGLWFSDFVFVDEIRNKLEEFKFQIYGRFKIF